MQIIIINGTDGHVNEQSSIYRGSGEGTEKMESQSQKKRSSKEHWQYCKLVGTPFVGRFPGNLTFSGRFTFLQYSGLHVCLFGRRLHGCWCQRSSPSGQSFTSQGFWSEAWLLSWFWLEDQRLIPVKNITYNWTMFQRPVYELWLVLILRLYRLLGGFTDLLFLFIYLLLWRWSILEINCLHLLPPCCIHVFIRLCYMKFLYYQQSSSTSQAYIYIYTRNSSILWGYLVLENPWINSKMTAHKLLLAPLQKD